MKKRSTEVCVVGAGAAGLMCAITAAASGARVLLLERERVPARKLRITGKGRCNVTNDCDADTALKNVLRNGRFLYSAMNAFPPSEAMAFFEGLGVPLKTERGSRVFPVSDRAEDIVNALLREAERLGVERVTATVTGVTTEDGAVRAVRCAELEVACAAAALCTGGLSYPLTGSTGDGYRFAEALGHSTTPRFPSLVPLCSNDPDCAAMQGLSLKNISLTLYSAAGKALYSELGEMQFTHFGLTGPLVLSASAHRRPGEGGGRVELDLKPGLDVQKLDARLRRLFAENQNRDFKNALGGLLPRLMEPVIVSRSGIPPETKVNTITKEQRAALLRALKHFSVAITGTRPVEEAVVTAGGVSVKEVNPSTMASRRVKGLYFAGEVLDVDAYTGGFNLQIAWCTGRAAGKAAAEAAEGRRQV